MIRVAPCAALVLLLAACVPAPTNAPPAPPILQPVQPAPPAVVVQVPQSAPASGDWASAPVTQGDWSWRSENGTSVATFRSPSGEVLAGFSCNPASGQVVIGVAGARAGDMTIRTETATRTLATSPSGIFVVATLAAGDGLLDALAFSKGHFALEATGTALYLPSYPEITRVVEDCR